MEVRQSWGERPHCNSQQVIKRSPPRIGPAEQSAGLAFGVIMKQKIIAQTALPKGLFNHGPKYEILVQYCDERGWYHLSTAATFLEAKRAARNDVRIPGAHTVIVRVSRTLVKDVGVTDHCKQLAISRTMVSVEKKK